jgi:hypothetical protein
MDRDRLEKALERAEERIALVEKQIAHQKEIIAKLERAGSYVTCEPRTLDRYGRTVAICRADGRDLGADMVADGHAWAFVRYSRDYVEEEREAAAVQVDTQPHMPARVAVARRAAIRSGQLKRSLVGLCASRWSPKRSNKCSQRLRPDPRRGLRAIATELAALD